MLGSASGRKRQPSAATATCTRQTKTTTGPNDHAEQLGFCQLSFPCVAKRRCVVVAHTHKSTETGPLFPANPAHSIRTPRRDLKQHVRDGSSGACGDASRSWPPSKQRAVFHAQNRTILSLIGCDSSFQILAADGRTACELQPSAQSAARKDSTQLTADNHVGGRLFCWKDTRWSD